MGHFGKTRGGAMRLGPKRSESRASLALLVVCTLLASCSLHLAAGVQTPSEVAPSFTLPNLDGDDVSLVDFRGSVVILEFWATWCEPCVRLFPEIHAVWEAVADRGAALLVVSLDKTEDAPRNFMIENDLPTDNVLWGSLESARAVKDLFGIVGTAHVVLIDRGGYVRYSGHPMHVTAEIIEPWLDASLMSQPPEDPVWESADTAGK